MSDVEDLGSVKKENEIPDNLGCYAIVKDGGAPNVLGKGEWGAVYKAFNSKFRCFSALRIIPHSAFPTEEAKRKFSADVRLATYIMGCRRLAAVFPLESTENAYLYGAELCSGEMLFGRVQREGCLPAEAALNAARQIAEALDAISKTDLRHQRITARNIILDEGEDGDGLRVKVLDLALPRSNSSETSATPHLECDFRSPEEKIAGSAVDSRSAIYTVGALLYYMLAGSEKYRSLRPKSSANEVNWPDDSTNLSAGCAAILEKTLGQEPALRLQTFAELRELLDQAIDSPESFEAAKRELALRRAQEEEDARRRVQEEAEAARRAKEEEEASRRALEESARRRAQEEAQRKAQEEEAARMRAQEQEAQRREQEEQATRRAQEEAQRQAQEEEAARIRAQEQEAQRKAREEAARRAAEAEKQRLAELEVARQRQKSQEKAKSEDAVARQEDEDAPSSAFPWVWVGVGALLVLGSLAGFYFWLGNPPQQKVVHQAVNPPVPVAANPPANQQPSQVEPSPSPTPTAPVPLPPAPPPVTSGTLTIDTDPTGARVTLDGKQTQTAPCAFPDVHFGTHHFVVERDGYKPSELDLPFDGSSLAPIKLEKKPDPFQALLDRIKAVPRDSPESLRASLDYLQQVKTKPPSPQLDPAKAQQDLSSALLDLEKKMISLPQYHHKDVYKDLLGNKVLVDAEALNSVPATVMLADSEFGVDDAKALELFKSAANQNDRYAMRMLGKLYEQTQDFEKSKEWINKASDAGDAYAHVLQLYTTLRDKNDGDPTVKATALKQLESEVEDWEKAVVNGDSSIDLPTLGRAEVLLGNYYYECYQNSQQQTAAGQSNPKDYRQMATELYTKSTEHGEPLGYYGLGKMAMDAHDFKEAKVQFGKGAGESPACKNALAKLSASAQ